MFLTSPDAKYIKFTELMDCVSLLILIWRKSRLSAMLKLGKHSKELPTHIPFLSYLQNIRT